MSAQEKAPASVALVTGGVGGLGSAICRALADAGHRVVAADLAHPERVARFNEDCRGHDIRVAPLDVTDAAACAALVADIERDLGPLQVLVNAAGITRDSTLRKMDAAQWDDVIRVNLTGVFNTCKAVLEPMSARGHGRIINISSVNGQTGQFGQTNYSAAKAGMHGFTMALARELARKGVTVNSISPGYCDTALVMTVPEEIRAGILASVPMGRMGRPEEIAHAVRFLADPLSGFITGANLPVNGGLFMSF